MDSLKITASLEDYLEAIYEIIEEKQGVKAIDISKRLGVGRSSVTEALKNLADKKLVNYGRYEVISLTHLGEKIAKRVIKKHEALYYFFSKILGTSPEEAEENACKVEHVISESAFDRLLALIEYNKRTHESSEQFEKNFQKFYQSFQAGD